MDVYSLTLGALSCACAACIYASVHIVEQGEAMIIQRFGRFVQNQTAGLHFILPFINSAKSVDWVFRHAEEDTLQGLSGTRIPLSELCYDPCPLECITKNGITVEVDLVVHFRVQDPEKAAYRTVNMFGKLEDTVETKLRDTVSKLGYEDLGQDALNAEMSLEQLNRELEDIGCVLTGVRVQAIRLPDSMRNATVETERLRLEQKAQLEKLDNEHRIKLQMAETRNAEQASEHEYQLAAVQHKLTVEKEQARIQNEISRLEQERKLDMERKSKEQALELKRAAQELKLEHEGKRSKHTLDCLEREAALFEDSVAYFQSKHQSESMRALSAANAKVIVAPSDVIQAAGRIPLVQATKLSD